MPTGHDRPSDGRRRREEAFLVYRALGMRSENVVLDPPKNQKGPFAPHFFR